MIIVNRRFLLVPFFFPFPTSTDIYFSFVQTALFLYKIVHAHTDISISIAFSNIYEYYEYDTVLVLSGEERRKDERIPCKKIRRIHFYSLCSVHFSPDLVNNTILTYPFYIVHIVHDEQGYTSRYVRRYVFCLYLIIPVQ